MAFLGAIRREQRFARLPPSPPSGDEAIVIRGVVFDLFHTLTARESAWSKLPWTSDVLGIDRQLWHSLLTEHSRWRLAGEERDPFTMIATLARRACPEISDSTIEEAVRVRIQRFRDCFAAIPHENVETLQRLRAAGYRLGLLSNADSMEIGPWSESSLAGLFDVEMFSCEVGLVKPEPAIFERCLEALGLPAEECLFVGDGGSGELTGAREVGMIPVFVSEVMEELWPERVNERKSECMHHISTVPEIIPLLARLAGNSGSPSPSRA